jgi:hypothetical protein
MGLRGQVDMPVVEHVDGFPHECRVVDISPRGMVVRQTSSLAGRSRRMLYRVELPLRGKDETISVYARTVWSDGPYVAMRYVKMSDVDQLEIAELLDRVGREGAVLH